MHTITLTHTRMNLGEDGGVVVCNIVALKVAPHLHSDGVSVSVWQGTERARERQTQ